jgi:L-lactate dehydrogenase complex protein LldF
MPAFPEAARVATKDTQLRANLTRATHTIRDKRAKAVAELEDWAELREAGKAIKDHTLRHLDHYLIQLEANVTAAGGHVHWARDADEANRIVTDLVQATGQTEGRQGQVHGHPGNRPQRAPRRRTASPPTKPTWPN